MLLSLLLMATLDAQAAPPQPAPPPPARQAQAAPVPSHDEAAALVKFNRLPEEYNDMVFAVVVCRWGFLGGFALWLLGSAYAFGAFMVAARAGSFSTAKAIATCPLSASATPTTATWRFEA